MLKGVNPVAVKVLRDQSYTSRDEFGREVALLKALHNSNIVQFQVRCPAATLKQDVMSVQCGKNRFPAGDALV